MVVLEEPHRSKSMVAHCPKFIEIEMPIIERVLRPQRYSIGTTHFLQLGSLVQRKHFELASQVECKAM